MKEIWYPPWDKNEPRHPGQRLPEQSQGVTWRKRYRVIETNHCTQVGRRMMHTPRRRREWIQMQCSCKRSSISAKKQRNILIISTKKRVNPAYQLAFSEWNIPLMRSSYNTNVHARATGAPRTGTVRLQCHLTWLPEILSKENLSGKLEYQLRVKI